jgi:hypothetical protein
MKLFNGYYGTICESPKTLWNQFHRNKNMVGLSFCRSNSFHGLLTRFTMMIRYRIPWNETFDRLAVVYYDHKTMGIFEHFQVGSCMDRRMWMPYKFNIVFMVKDPVMVKKIVTKTAILESRSPNNGFNKFKLNLLDYLTLGIYTYFTTKESYIQKVLFGHDISEDVVFNRERIAQLAQNIYKHHEYKLITYDSSNH